LDSLQKNSSGFSQLNDKLSLMLFFEMPRSLHALSPSKHLPLNIEIDWFQYAVSPSMVQSMFLLYHFIHYSLHILVINRHWIVEKGRKERKKEGRKEISYA
jgi:hypothetical protein